MYNDNVRTQEGGMRQASATGRSTNNPQKRSGIWNCAIGFFLVKD